MNISKMIARTKKIKAGWDIWFSRQKHRLRRMLYNWLGPDPKAAAALSRLKQEKVSQEQTIQALLEAIKGSAASVTSLSTELERLMSMSQGKNIQRLRLLFLQLWDCPSDPSKPGEAWIKYNAAVTALLQGLADLLPLATAERERVVEKMDKLQAINKN